MAQPTAGVGVATPPGDRAMSEAEAVKRLEAAVQRVAAANAQANLLLSNLSMESARSTVNAMAAADMPAKELLLQASAALEAQEVDDHDESEFDEFEESDVESEAPGAGRRFISLADVRGGLPPSLAPRRLELDDLAPDRAHGNFRDEGGQEQPWLRASSPTGRRSESKLKVGAWLRKSAGHAEPVEYGEDEMVDAHLAFHLHLKAREADDVRVLPSLEDVAAAGGDVPVLRVLAAQGDRERLGKELSGLGFSKLGDRRLVRPHSNSHTSPAVRNCPMHGVAWSHS